MQMPSKKVGTMTDKIQTLNTLCSGLDYEIYEDDILMANATIGSQHYGIDMSQCTPTFILKVDQDFVALIIQGSRKIDFKKVEAHLGAKKATMASREEILNLTGSLIGSVSLINPQLRTLIDHGVSDIAYCYGGCGVEKHTLKIKSQDLIGVTRAELSDFTKSI
jgi:prolyl-tRNA editing enzyme YbaK/EbsC (Cys-tRNA(Pro) deacylase)